MVRSLASPLLADVGATDADVECEQVSSDQFRSIGDFDNLGVVERADRLCTRFWYTPPSQSWSFVLIEAIKLLLNSAFFTGVANSSFWAACAFPATEDQAECGVRYSEMWTAEVLFVLVMTVISAILRQQRRRHDVVPNLNAHIRLTLYLEDVAPPFNACDSLRSLEVGLLRDGIAADDQQQALAKIAAKLSTAKNHLTQMRRQLQSYREFRLESSCYFYANEAIRVPVGAFLGFSATMLLLLMRASVSREHDYVWHANPFSDFGPVAFLALGLGAVAGAFLAPDDLTTQNNDLRLKLLAQYGTLASRCKAEKKSLLESLKKCDACLARMQADAHLPLTDRSRTTLVALKEQAKELRQQAQQLNVRDYLRSERGIISAGKTARAIRLGI